MRTSIVRPLALLAAFAMLSTACGSTRRVVAPTGEILAAPPGAAAPGDTATDVGFAEPGLDEAGLDAPVVAQGATGTTVTGSGATSGTTAGTTNSTGTSAGTTSQPAQPAAPGAAPAPESTAGSAPAPPATASPAPGQPAAPAPGAPAQGAAPTADRTPVKLGIIILKNGEATVAGLGTEVSFGDGRLQSRAVVEEINKNGGIGGRPIDPYYAEVDVAATDPESNYNAACSKLTEDDGVFAVMTVINPPESFIACVANHQTLLLNASFSPGDDTLYGEFKDWFFSPSLVSLDRGARLMLNSAKAEGRFDALGVNVGILYYDGDPQPARVVEQVMEPMLKAWNVPVTKAGISGPEGVGGAQLQFAAAGVNLVLFQTPNGIGQLLFMNAAENQGYRPAYYTTDPDSTRFVSESAPRNQAANIAGVGSLPLANVPVRSYPTTPKEEECLKLMRAAGENDNDRLSSLTATLYCELMWEFRIVGEQVQGPLTHENWRAAFPTIGTGYTSVSTFATNFASGRNDNATQYRPYAWDTGCSCLAYTGPAVAIPNN